MTEEKNELTFTFDEDGKEYKVEDLSDENKILYNKVSATLKLQRIVHDFFNGIIDEKINALHHLVHNSEGKK